jgi:hypothetical protein
MPQVKRKPPQKTHLNAPCCQHAAKIRCWKTRFPASRGTLHRRGTGTYRAHPAVNMPKARFPKRNPPQKTHLNAPADPRTKAILRQKKIGKEGAPEPGWQTISVRFSTISPLEKLKNNERENLGYRSSSIDRQTSSKSEKS